MVLHLEHYLEIAMDTDLNPQTKRDLETRGNEKPGKAGACARRGTA